MEKMFFVCFVFLINIKIPIFFTPLKAAKALLCYIRVPSVIVISTSYGDNYGVDNTLSCLPSEI